MVVNSKVYFNKLTGEVIRVTGEMMGCVLKTTIEDDLKGIDYDVNVINILEIPYGKFVETFHNSKSYHVDVNSKTLIVEYFTEKEIEEMNKYTDEPYNESLEEINERLIDEIINLKAENLMLKMEG